MKVETKPQAKSFFKKILSKIKLTHFIILYIAVLFFPPLLNISLTSEEGGNIFTIEAKIPYTKYKYEKVFVLLDD